MMLSNSQKKRALITGVTGQDGAYLSELLLRKGYEVHGIKRRSSSFNTARVDHLYDHADFRGNFHLHYGDLSDSTNLIRLVEKIRPDEIYNLGAMSHVRVSFDAPEYTADIDGLGALRLLEAIRICGMSEHTRFYQASTSELYGKVQEIPQRETTPFYPRSPYGVAKLYAYGITINYREAYNIYATNGILFNHESPLRGETFVTRKITRAVAAIKYGQQEVLTLGNLDAQRDWGFAGDYVEGIWLSMQQSHADDFVLATGETHSIRDFVERAFSYIDVKIQWKGQHGSVEEYGVDSTTGKTLVQIDARYFRPTEVDILIGDPSKAREKLGWVPKVSYPQLIEMMVQADLDLASGRKQCYQI